MVTIKEVARLAGVSPATVSHVINHTRTVAPETTARVKTAMKQLNYQLNAVASSLRRRTTNTIGVIVSDYTNPFFGLVVRGIENTASKFGFQILMCDSNGDLDREKQALRLLKERRVDGLIVSAATGEGSHFFASQQGVPLVFINRIPDDVQVDSIATDNVAGARAAVTHFLKLNRQRIACITGPTHLLTGRDRLRGCEEALINAGRIRDPELIKTVAFAPEAAKQATQSLLKLTPRPDAIFAGSYPTTLGTLQGLQEAGIRIPQEIALIGFDDPDWAELFTPSLTTVSQPRLEIGQKAVELLVRRIKERDERGAQQGGHVQVRLLPELIIRQSCGNPSWKFRKSEDNLPA